MNNIKKILIPVDLSESSEKTLNYVKGLVKNSPDAQVILLYVCSTSVSDQEIESKKLQLTALVKIWSDKLPYCTFQLKTGDLINTILQVQQESNVDLIIMGTGGEQDKKTETVTSRLVLEADCPVLVIPISLEKFSLKSIALALGENTIDNSGGLEALHDIARTFDATVHILSVNRNGGDPVIKAENQEVLDYYLESLLYFHAFPKNSDIELGISEYIQKHQIDMLAILPRNHARSTKPSDGRLTKLLTLRTKVPLLTID